MNRILTIALFLIAPFFLISQTLDANGWTRLNVNTVEKVVYVSSSQGSSQGVVYNYPSNAIGNDPIKPNGGIKAFKTIAQAVAKIGNNESAWVLLKRGDTFTNESLIAKSGKSPKAPFIYSSYGTSNKLPLLRTGTRYGINYDKNLRNFWIIGLSFYSHTRNPRDRAYISSAGNHGFNFLAKNGVTMDNITIEGNTYRFHTSNVIQARGGILRNVRIRRNFFFDNYSETNHSQGIYSQAGNGVLVEENIFDHNGWYKQAVVAGGPGGDKKGGQGTIFNHNTYFVDMKNTTFKGNSFHRPSSMGTKWTANNGSASANGIEIDNNLYNDCELAIGIGGNKRDSPYRFKNVTIKNNVITDLGRSQPTHRTLAWGINIEDWDQGVCSDNLLISQKRDILTSCNPMSFKGQNRNVDITNNILHNMKNAFGFTVSGSATFNNVNYTRNVVSLPKNKFKHYIQLEGAHRSGLKFANNLYNIDVTQSESFRINRQNINLQAWRNTTKEAGLKTSIPNYKAPERDLDLYIKNVLKLSNRDQFYTNLRQLSRLNWKKEYTANAINSWIREGFGGPAVNPNPTPKPPTGGDSANVYNNFWKIENIGTSKIMNSEKCASSGGFTAPLVASVKGVPNQCSVFRFVPTNNGFFRIENRQTGFWYRPKDCTVGTQVNASEVVQVSKQYTGSCTEWKLIDLGKGEYRIENKSTKLWLRPQNCNRRNRSNSPLILVPTNYTGTCTKWKLENAGAIRGSDLITDTEGSLLIYPNPAKDQVTLQSSTSFNDLQGVTIYDLQGRITKRLPVSELGLDSTSTLTIDVSAMNNGMYIIATHYNNRETQHSQFIIRH